MSAMSSDLSGPPAFGDSSTNIYSPNNVTNTPPDYGTNLWIAQTAVAGAYLMGIASNTLPEVQYSILSVTNLLQAPNWNLEGTIVGSDLTNWTPLNVARNNRATLFIRLRSDLSADGSGIPSWWEAQYFGTNAVRIFGDPMGDGFNNLYKYEHGMSPYQYYTPTAPQGFTVLFNPTTKNATLKWIPSAGNLTNYTIEKSYSSNGYTYQTADYLTSSSTFLDSLAANVPDPTLGNVYYVSYKVRGNYLGGSSRLPHLCPSNKSAPLLPLSPGPNGTTDLAVWGVPPNATTIRLSFIDALYENGNHVSTYDYSNDIPVSSFTNSLFPLSSAYYPPRTDSQGIANYGVYVASVDAQGNVSEANIFDSTYGWPTANYNWGTPFYDGRVQLKQNLVFQLRAAPSDGSVLFSYAGTFNYPSNCAVSGYYQYADQSFYPGTFDEFLPFEENYLFRNFVMTLTNADASGNLTTGVSGGNGSPYYAVLTPTFYFDTNHTPYQSWLATNGTRWLAYDQLNGSDDLNALGIIYTTNNAQGRTTIILPSGEFNWFGLPYINLGVVGTSASSGQVVNNVINAGHGLTSDDFSNPYQIYTETLQPRFKTQEYDFWPISYSTPLPGDPSFSTTNQSPLFITTVANEWFNIAGYAKLLVTNSVFPDVVGYLGQYFQQAYQIDAYGNVTTNSTGIVSPYGSFFATQPGPAAVVTMPDPDTQQQGTCTVYAVSLQVDKNHDGKMDLSFGGADSTSPQSPMRFWVNNDNDWSYYTGDPGQGLMTPTNNGDYVYLNIPSQRDLEDYARLWLCGMPSLTTNYQVTLSWNVVSGNPAVNLVKSVETNGGTLYLTDLYYAASQTYGSTSSDPGYKFARITPDQPYTFPANYFAQNGNKYFLFEGVGFGVGELTLTVYKNSTQIAQTGVWLDLRDIKELYEQAHATNVTSGLPPSSLISQNVIDHTTVTMDDETKQIVIFVHGINNTGFNYYNTTETIYKRLYWSGYHGKVAGYRWPCAYLPFDNTLNPFQFDRGEYYAWKSASALKSYLTYLRNRPDLTNYTINIFAHSQGNIVASEAIKEGAPFDNYILTQGAVPAHCYDTTVPLQQKFLNAEASTPTPLSYTNGGYNGYFAGLSGNLVDFYNTNDYALISGTWMGFQANWEQDQVSQKPEDFGYMFGQYYVYHTSNGLTFSISDFSQSDNYTVIDPVEIKAMVARSRTHAVGAQANVAGALKTSAAVDLVGSFGFGNTREEHSAQFDRPIQTSWSYFDEVLTTFGVLPISRH